MVKLRDRVRIWVGIMAAKYSQSSTHFDGLTITLPNQCHYGSIIISITVAVASFYFMGTILTRHNNNVVIFKYNLTKVRVTVRIKGKG